MLVFRESVGTGTLREKPLDGEKTINKLNPYVTPSQIVLSQVNWGKHVMETSCRKDLPHQPPFGVHSCATVRKRSPRLEVALHAK